MVSSQQQKIANNDSSYQNHSFVPSKNVSSTSYYNPNYLLHPPTTMQPTAPNIGTSSFPQLTAQYRMPYPGVPSISAPYVLPIPTQPFQQLLFTYPTTSLQSQLPSVGSSHGMVSGARGTQVPMVGYPVWPSTSSQNPEFFGRMPGNH
jgi:hypothetical protein